MTSMQIWFLTAHAAVSYVTCNCSHADLELSLAVLESGRVSETTATGDRVEQITLDIRRGQIVSLRAVLRNTGPGDSIAVTPSLRPEAGVHEFILITPNGDERILGRGRWQRHYCIAPRPLHFGEEIGFETWFFADVVEKQDAQTRALRMYIFDEPGEYQIYSKFVLPDPRHHNGVGTSQNASIVESNRVVIRVEGSIPGWEDLKSAGILDAVDGSFREIGDQRKRERLELLVRASGDPGLIEWLEITRLHLHHQP